MKKLTKKIALATGTLGIIIAGAAAFSAFEAHVINVTARIENALNVPVRSLDFGTVFPQEALDQQFDVFLSDSFLAEDRVDDVNYFIRQKPKCGIPIPGTDPVEYSGFVQVGEDVAGNFVCPEVLVGDQLVQSVALPLLCPYLSKEELTTDGGLEAPDENDGPRLSSFHGPISLADWTMAVARQWDVTGRLAKSELDENDTWNIDLKVPCFGKHCAQDWADFVARNGGTENQANPEDYIQPIENEHEIFGCDLWLEVSGISLTPENGTITVHKVIAEGDALPSDFAPYMIDGQEVSLDTPISVSVGQHTVTETNNADYNAVFSEDCDLNGFVNVAGAQSYDCTITNTLGSGTLTVSKVIVGGPQAGNPAAFGFSVNGGGATAFEGDGSNDEVLAPGVYDVTEAPVANYTPTYSNSQNANSDCDNLSISNGGSATCTITNTFVDPNGTLNVTKVIVGGPLAQSPQSFSFQVDGGSTTAFEGDGSNAVSVAAGSHSVLEVSVPANYTPTYANSLNGSANCNNLNVPSAGSVTCTITNTFVNPNGTLNITKIVNNGDGGTADKDDFSYQVNGGAVTPFESDGTNQESLPAGTYDVTEPAGANYTATYANSANGNANCDDLPLASGGSVTCTITNTFNPAPPQSVSLLSDGFGVSDSSDTSFDEAPVWTEGGSGATKQAASTGNNSASANGSRFALILGTNGWICRTINAVGFNSVNLSYYWRGDVQAENTDLGIVEIKPSSGNACSDATGWTGLQSHDMSNDAAWSTQAAFGNAGMNNVSFLLRFRIVSDSSAEDFRIDGVSVTGTP